MLNTIAATATAGYLTHHGHATVAARDAAVHGYTTAFTVSAALLVAAGVVAGTLIRSARHHTQPEAAEDLDELAISDLSTADALA